MAAVLSGRAFVRRGAVDRWYGDIEEAKIDGELASVMVRVVEHMALKISRPNPARLHPIRSLDSVWLGTMRIIELTGARAGNGHTAGIVFLTAIAVLAGCGRAGAEGASPAQEESKRRSIVEIRSYNLVPGTRAEFQRLVVEAAVPMLRRRDMDLVAHGPSLHDDDSYYLIRRFADLDDRRRREDAFYGSAEWREGPREAILSLIESYTTIVLELDQATIDGLRTGGPDRVGRVGLEGAEDVP